MILRECNLSEEFETLELFVFSDLHVGDPLFDRDKFFAARQWVLDAPNRYCILNGDLMNTATKDSVSDVYGDIMSPAEQLKWCKEHFAPLKDRILSITNGNHEDRIRRSTSIDVVASLADSLGLAHLHYPEGVTLKVTFGRKRNQKRAAFTVYHTHGRGGGALQGGKVLRMARMSNVILADVYVSSHTHFKVVFKESVWVPDLHNNKVRLMEQTFVNSSALLNWGGYAQVAGYKPSALGSPHITLIPEPKEVRVTL